MTADIARGGCTTKRAGAVSAREDRVDRDRSAQRVADQVGRGIRKCMRPGKGLTRDRSLRGLGPGEDAKSPPALRTKVWAAFQRGEGGRRLRQIAQRGERASMGRTAIPRPCSSPPRCQYKTSAPSPTADTAPVHRVPSQKVCCTPAIQAAVRAPYLSYSGTLAAVNACAISSGEPR